MKELSWLEQWFKSQCDGEWEHTYGIKIETLDNPGWELQIELQDTPWENKAFANRQLDEEDTWIHCYKEGGRFLGYCSIGSLDEIIRIFREWVDPD